MRRSKLFLLITITLLFQITSLSGQPNQVGTIDFYGIISNESDLKKCLPFSENDSLIYLAENGLSNAKEKIIKCLLSKQDIKRADISFVCCNEQGKWIVFVGVDTKGHNLRPVENIKQADTKLQLEMKNTYDSLMMQTMIALEKGQPTENDSNGHALMDYMPARQLQEKFIVYANKDLSLLREVLRNSNDHEQREVAATIIAYHHDKRAIINDLLDAVSDTHVNVRNNAIRAIGIIADYSNRKPELKIKIPVDPFIVMINSIYWTDRNKASFVLLALTNNRDIKVLEQLKKEAFQPIVNMATWKSDGHSMPGYMILGRIAGWTDKEIMDGMTQRKESVNRMLAQINN